MCKACNGTCKLKRKYFEDTPELLNEEEQLASYPEFDEERDLIDLGLESDLLSEVDRRIPAYVRWIQSSLNKILGTRLAVDGIIGPQTRSAVRSFQSLKGLLVDGIVGPQTEKALIIAGANPPGTSAGQPIATPTIENRVNTPLPTPGPGYYSYTSTSRQYGLPETIQALQTIGLAWQTNYPQGPRIGIGDISFMNGGTMPPHKSHQKGVDVDIRPVRNDGKEGSTNYQFYNYSRTLTQNLVDFIRDNGILPVRYVFFNDPSVSGVTKELGHDNHLHIRFSALHT